MNQERGRNGQSLRDGQRHQDRADAILLRHPASQESHEHDTDRLPETKCSQRRPDASRRSQGRRLGAGKTLDDGPRDAVFGEQDHQETQPDDAMRLA